MAHGRRYAVKLGEKHRFGQEYLVQTPSGTFLGMNGKVWLYTFPAAKKKAYGDGAIIPAACLPKELETQDTHPEPPLMHDGEDDYTLEGRGVWITVNNLSVWIHRDDTGVSVDICPLHDEANRTLSGVFQPFDYPKEKHV